MIYSAIANAELRTRVWNHFMKMDQNFTWVVPCKKNIGKSYIFFDATAARRFTDRPILRVTAENTAEITEVVKDREQIATKLRGDMRSHFVEYLCV